MYVVWLRSALIPGQILHARLYPFYYQVCQANPGREVWIIEDRASPHKKAAEIEAEYRSEMEIRSCILPGDGGKLIGWPSNSPDLNMIEPG